LALVEANARVLDFWLFLVATFALIAGLAGIFLTGLGLLETLGVTLVATFAVTAGLAGFALAGLGLRGAFGGTGAAAGGCNLSGVASLAVIVASGKSTKSFDQLTSSVAA
jgi:hypothetical protein